MKRFFALAALVLGLAACQTEPEGLDVNVGGEQLVTVNVTVPEAETRADVDKSAKGVFDNGILEGDATMRYILQVYYNGVASKERLVEYSDEKSVTFEVRLVPGRNYQFVVWADVVDTKDAEGKYVDKHYNTADLANITLNSTWVAMDESRDAFTATELIENYSGASNINITLKRPFAKLRVVTTDIKNLQDLGIKPTKATVAYSTDHRVAFDAYTGAAKAADDADRAHTEYTIATYPNEWNEDGTTKGTMTLFSDYFFAENDVTQFNFKVYDQNNELIKENSFVTDIYVKRNYLTTIKGNILTDGKGFEVKIEDAFAQPEIERPVVEVHDANALQDAINNAEDGKETTITLGGDIDLNDLLGAGILSTRATAYTSALEIPAGKSLVLDLKEHNLVYSTDVQNRAMIHNNGDLTIKSTTGAVKYTYTGANDTTYAVGNYAINNAGTLTIEGNVEAIAGTVGQKFSHAFYAINTSGELIVNSGKILNNTNIAIRQWVGSESKTSAITVNGGEIEGLRGIWVQLPNSNTNLAPKGKITVTGGTITGTAIDGTMDSENILAIYSYSYGNQMKNVEIEISGGTFNGDIALTGGRSGAKVDVEKITITGGVFNGLWGDVYSYAEDALAKDVITIKGGEFSSIAPLVYLNAADEVVKLGKDIENAEPIVFNGEGTLNLNGKSVSAVDDTEKNYQLIDNRGKLAVVGDGTMTVEATINSGWNRYSAVIANNPGGNLTVNGATLEHLGGTDMAYGIDNLTNGKGTYAVTTIENATIKSPYRAVRQFLNGVEATNELYVKAGAKLEGDNKSIFFHDPSKNANTGKLVVEEGAELYGDVYLFVTAGSTEWPVEVSIVNSALKNGSEVISANTPAGYEVVNVNGVWTLSYTCAAKIGEIEYKSLKAAVEAVKDGETITLARDIIFDENSRQSSGGTWYEGLYYIGNKSFTIDLNGKTISQNGAVNDYLFLFKNDTNTENTINFINGTLDAGTSAYCALCTSTTSTAKITINLENVNLNGNNSNGGVAKIRGGAELNVNAGTIITGADSYVGIEAYGATVNIYEGAEIYQNGKSSYVGSLVGVSGNGTVNVYGGKGTSAQGGFIAMTSGGTINVSGGEWTANTDGTYANDNKGVLIAQSASGAKSVVNVTGGTFKGGYNCYGDAAGDAQINIKGGNFNSNPENYVVAGYKGVEENGIWTVVVDPAAKIGETEYASLQEAFNVGGEITLLRDITIAETVVLAEGKTVVLDLNGKTLAAVDKNTIKNNGGNLTLKNGTVTRTGDVVGYSVNNASGEINVVDATVERGLYTSGSKMTATNANISHEQSSRHAIYAWDCEVTINSGIFHNDNAGNATLMASGSSVVTINGGTFSIADGRSALGWTSSMIDQNSTAQVIVKGGLFNGGFRINSADTTLTIEGGEFNTNNGSSFTDYSGTKVVKGGKFTDTGAQNWAKKYIAEGYEMNANGEVVAK